MFVTEPSVVAPDASVYLGDIVFKTEEITKTELRQPVWKMRSNIRRYRARFGNGLAYSKLTHYSKLLMG
jgi:hypothetical protein